MARGKVSVDRPGPKTLRGRPRVPFFPSPPPPPPPLTPRVFTRRHRYAFSARRGAFPSTRTACVTDARACAHMPRDSVKTTRERCWTTPRRRHGTSTGKGAGIEEKSHPFREGCFLRDIPSKYRVFLMLIVQLPQLDTTTYTL